MKKNFLFMPILGLVGSTLLASCSSHLSIEDGALIQVGPKEYTLQEIYDLSRDNKTAAKSYYDLLDDIYTQLAIPADAGMQAGVDKSMNEDFYEAAETNAKNNSTTVKEEKEKLLEAAKVDNVEQLRQSKLLAAQKTKASDDYYSESNIKSNLLAPYIEKDAPYHVKHILVKTSAASGEYHRATITADQSEKLGRVVMRLASHDESFGDIAHTASEDTGSASTYGDLGIMDKNTSFVSEFKLGDFVWDMKFNSAVTDKQVVKTTLGPSATGVSNFDEQLNSYTLFGIPFSSAIALTELNDVEADDTGHKPAHAEDVNYPRNVIFNSYYNNHSMSLVVLSEDDMNSMKATYGADYITDADVTDYKAALEKNTKTVKELGLSGQIKSYVPVLKKGEDGSFTFTFNTVAAADTARVLTDEQGNPVLVARAGNSSGSSSSDSSNSSSYEGVHFIVNQRDPFQSYTKTDGSDYTMAEYYDVDLTTALASKDKNFLNYIQYSQNSDYNSRVTSLTNAIKETGLTNNNSTFKVYENTKKSAEDQGYKVNVPANIQNLVDSYISSTEALNDYNNNNTYDRAWTSYFRMLNFQQDTMSLNLPLQSLNQFGDGNISIYIDLSSIKDQSSVDFANLDSSAFTNERPAGTYGVDWIYNPAYVGSSAGDVK